MLNFYTNFFREFKRLFRIKQVLLVIVLIVIISIAVNSGINCYRSLVDNGKEFQDIEKLNYTRLKKYSDLAIKGIGFYSLPSPLVLISINSIVFSDICARIDTVITLDISGNLKGSSLFHSNSPISLNFSGIILLFFTLFSLFIGYASLRETEYLKSLSSICSDLKVFFSNILARLFFLALALIVLYVPIWVFLEIKNIELLNADILVLLSHMGAALIMLIFFFFIGAVIGLIFRSKWFGITLSLAVWTVLVFGGQCIINSIVKKEAENITSNYTTESEQFKIAVDFEKRIEKKYGKFNKKNIEVERNIIEDYWENERKQIERLEEKLKNEISEVIDTNFKISIFTPTSFFNMTCNAVSSRGYDQFLEFYSYLQIMKRELLRFWFDQVYYEDPPVMVPFIKGDENIFVSESHVPRYYLKGLLINLGYILILAFITYPLFKISLYRMRKKDIAELGKVDLELDNGDLNVWFVEGNNFINLLYNLFSGKYKTLNKKGFSGEVLINGVNIASEKCKEDFIYICPAQSLPGDAKVKDFITTYARLLKIPPKEKKTLLDSTEIKSIADKTIDKLNKNQAFEILLSLMRMKKKRVYLIDDITTGLPINYAIKLKDQMAELAEEGSIVLYLTIPVMTDLDLSKLGLCFQEGRSWIYWVEENKKILEMQKK